jgi:NAD(P)-dependent dehydrogenase (short-subunit alcohol dehydrogenase family)
MDAVLITGGTQGIGRAIADQLDENGTPVFAAAIDALPPMQVDVREEPSVDALFRHIETSGHNIKALVHCAGIGIFKPLVDLSLKDWNNVVSTNLTGAFLCTRAAIRHMLPRGGGRIIHIGSVAAQTPLVANGAYGSAKAGLRMLTQIINEEHKSDGIRATLLTLGATYTDIWKGLPQFSPADMLSVQDVANMVVAILSQHSHVRIDEMTVVPPKGIL